MASIQEVYDLWSVLEKDFDSIIENSIKENEEIIISSQVDQMRHGQNSEGNQIGLYHSLAYEQMKDVMGLQEPAPPGVVNLYLTGAFTKGIKLEYSKDFIMPNSIDDKNDKLIGKYGEMIYGLTLERLSKVNQENILPSLQKNIRIIIHI
jgi:hypothetical protein